MTFSIHGDAPLKALVARFIIYYGTPHGVEALNNKGVTSTILVL